MGNEVLNKPPKWFWVAGVAALLWNSMGAKAYLDDAYMSIEELEKMTQAQRLLFESQPAWTTGAFAIAVWGGVLACVLLLLRKKWAVPVFVISLIGILAHMIYVFFLSNAMEVYGPGGMVLPILVIVIGILMVFFSRTAVRKGWLS
ncbi:MAG: hypothetical protein AAFX53_16465 [Bacteroidota bacterium]